VTEQQLIKLYLSGQSSAFDTLYKRHKDNLYRFILGMVGNHHCAEDVAAKVWCKFLDKCDVIETNPIAYLYAIARNQVAEYFRKQKVSESFEEEDVAHSCIIEAKAESDGIVSKLNKLPFEQREALLLKHLAGYSLDEIAYYQDINRESAKTRLRYAMSKIRHILSPVGN
jgi:RNA polymerase sigma-70 factor (ECF subfamily)